MPRFDPRLVCLFAASSDLLVVFDNYDANVMIDGVTVQLGLWDTAVREDGDRLVALSYPNTDVHLFVTVLVEPASLTTSKVFFICFSVVSLNSLANCPRYIKQTRDVVPNAHMFLVGLKSDLREDTAVLECVFFGSHEVASLSPPPPLSFLAGS